MGPIQNNVYIIGDGTTAIVVDPTEEAAQIAGFLEGRTCAGIVLTHAHWDHVGAARELRDLTGAPTIASEVDAPYIDGTAQLGTGHTPFDPCPIDRTVKDCEMVQIGNMQWRAMLTPGHTPGSMCFFLDSQFGFDPEGVPVLIAGDTLFAGAHGRTDFEGGSPADMRESLKRLANLPENTLVLPGHNNLTTIARELSWLVRGGF